MAKSLAKRPQRGRPEYAPTDENRRVVAAMAGYGIPHDQIRLVVLNPATGEPVAKRTLARAFRAELQRGVVQANTKVIESLYNMAVGRMGIVVRTVDTEGRNLGEVVETVPTRPVPGCAIFWAARRMPGWQEGGPPGDEKPQPGAKMPEIRFTLNLGDVQPEDVF